MDADEGRRAVVQDSRIPSTAVMILQLLGYVLAFALPITIAAILLPAAAPWIVVGGIVLFLAVTGFILGWEWESQKWTPKARGHLKFIGLMLIWVPVVRVIWDTTREPGNLRLYLTVLAVMEFGLAVTTVPAFYLGRVMYRKKTARA